MKTKELLISLGLTFLAWFGIFKLGQMVGRNEIQKLNTAQIDSIKTVCEKEFKNAWNERNKKDKRKE